MTGQHFVAGLLAQIEAGTYAWRVPPMQPNHINVEIDAWIIQDGNYGEFAVGDGLTLAFEFVAESVFKTTNVKRSIKQIDGATYEVCAQIIHYTPTVWAIDFGISVYQELKPPEGYQVGDWITCEVLLRVDPFFSIESVFNGFPACRTYSTSGRLPELIWRQQPGSSPDSKMAVPVLLVALNVAGAR